MGGNNAILCPGCRKLISRDEEHCPYCGLRRPGRGWKRLLGLGRPAAEQLIPALIVINVLFYLASLLLSPSSIRGGFANPLNFLSPGGNSLLVLGATGKLPIFHLRRWWTLISACFLHGSLLHLLFNMVALSQLGRFAGEIFGPYRCLIIYLLSGALGFFLSALAGIPLTIGASASICGLIGALLYYGKHRGGQFGRLVVEQVRGWIIGLVLIGLFLPSINNWGHGGGLLAGMALAALLGYQEKRRAGIVVQGLALSLALATILILLWALLQAAVRFF